MSAVNTSKRALAHDRVRDARRVLMLGSIAMLTVLVVLSCCAVSALASGPVWRLDSEADTTVTPGGTLEYLLSATDVGDTATDGSDIVVQATLPAGVTAVSAEGSESGFAECKAGDGSSSVSGASTIRCVRSLGEGPNFQLRVKLVVAVPANPAGVLASSFSVSGGGAATVSTVDPTRVSLLAPAFGIDAFDGQVSAADGSAFTQAGGHPYSAAASIDFNTLTNPNPQLGAIWPVQPTKDVLVDLPPGFVGNPTVAAKCIVADLANSDGIRSLPLCSPDSQVGTALVHLNGQGSNNMYGPVPVFNMVPPPDVPARFGFNVAGVVVTLDAVLRSGGDYGFSIDARNISEGLDIAGTSLTFWGVPSDPSHDPERACSGQLAPWDPLGGAKCTSSAPREAFLRNPTSCTASAGEQVTDGLTTFVHIDSWTDPGRLNADGSADLTDPAWQTSQFTSHLPPGYPSASEEWGTHVLPKGCENVPFDPSLKTGPAVDRTNSPSAFSFEVGLPQSNDPSAIAEADLKSASVTLPAGVRVSPSAAAGLQGCSPEQIVLHSSAQPTCPDASKVGSLKITTPLLTTPLTGSVYLATPHDNPFGSLIAMYLVAKGPGVIVKVAGEVHADEGTGQLTATFDNNPQAPFSELELRLDGGAHAPLVTPPGCGTYVTHATFGSWSAKSMQVDAPFTIDHGTDGGACAAQGFSPALTARTQEPVAGAFAAFALQLTRSDADAELGSLGLSLPPGLLGDIASVPIRCTIAQANAAACPAASHIGEVSTGAGAGPSPYYVNGDAYLTGPLDGDPFGLAVVIDAAAGPFDLGYVTVMNGLQVNDDGSVTAHSQPFPTIIQGIPLQVRDIRVNLDRPGFMLNPTNCTPMSITGTVGSTTGQAATVSDRFQVGECSRLAFKPGFKVSVTGHTNRVQGAGLAVNVSSGKGQANIHSVKVSLPKQLPSRNSTLKLACPASVFDQNPAACPAGSHVGTAIAHTPILTSALTGPAYLVSHGGAAFPDLVIVLQGEGIILHLTGHTNIKNGITTSTFDTVPDAPVSNFVLKLPQGPHSILAAPSGRLCETKLSMGTTLTGQNGMVIGKTTKIAVSGCTKRKAVKHKKKKGK